MAIFEHLPETLRSILTSLPCPSFAVTPAVGGVPLARRRIALVSTAGLHLASDRPFVGPPGEYRAIPADVGPEELTMSHISMNYDRSGFQRDWNVVFPLERLRELVDAGVVGGMAKTHYSFMGATEPASLEPTAREVAARLRAEGVDGVLLLPVCPFCTRSVGVLGHYLEQEGIATTSISLVRPHTEAIRPSRALWVPFDMGRPLGAPEDPELQRRVMLRALALLERSDVPVLEDDDGEAPAAADGNIAGLACPVPEWSENMAIKQAVLDEIRGLRPLYLAARNRGRWPASVLGLGAEAEAAFVLSFLDATPAPNPRPELPLPQVLALAAADLRTFYQMAAIAQAGSLSSERVARWLWHETALGRALRVLRGRLLESQDPMMRAMAYLRLVPIAYAEPLEVETFLDSFHWMQAAAPAK